jgi:glycosyltransferase involved in cell wall biosynthesis
MLSGMQILIVAPTSQSLPTPGYGAVERVVLGRVEALSRLGATVFVVAKEGSIVPGASQVIGIHPKTKKGVAQVRRVTPIQGSFARAASLGELEILCRLSSSTVPLEHLDLVIHDSLNLSPWNVLAWRKVEKNTRIVAVLHGNLPFWSQFRSNPLLSGLTLGALNGPLARSLRDLGWPAWHFPNGVAFPPEIDICPNPANELIFVGRICPEKGTHIAIQLAKEMGVPLTIIGPISDFDYFRTRVGPYVDSQTVSYLGEVDQGTLDSHFRRALALVFTSQYEDPYPTVILEALRFGTPIIGLAWGKASGFHELCDDTNSVSARTLEGLLPKCHLVRDLDRLQIHRHARKSHSWDEVIQKFYYPILCNLK